MGKRATMLAVLAVGFGAAALTGCNDPAQVGEIKAKVDEIQAQQKDILAKLDTVTGNTKKILERPAAAAKPSRPQEDPNKVYDIPVGKSFSKGPADASVTIIEFSDFQ